MTHTLMSSDLVDDFALYLNEIGLSEYESRAYLSVLQAGLTTAAEISEASEVPQSRVYGVLETLEEKGFITVQPGRPKKFGPIEPEHALNQYLQYKRENFEDTLSQTRSVGNQFINELNDKNFQYRQNDEVDVFWSYKGKNYILNQFGDYCASASDRIWMIMKGNSFRRVVNQHKEVLQNCAENGVDIRIVVSHEHVENVILNTARNWADVRYAPNIEGRIYLFDSDRVLISWLSDREDRFVALATQSSQLQTTFGQLFEMFWHSLNAEERNARDSDQPISS